MTIGPVWLDISMYISYILVIVFSSLQDSFSLSCDVPGPHIGHWSIILPNPRLDGLQSPGMILADCLWNKTK